MCWSFLPHVRFLILLTVFELLPKTCNFSFLSLPHSKFGMWGYLWSPDQLSLVSSPDPKGHVSYCHHLASVVRRKLVRFLILLTVFELLPKTCNFTICSIFSNSGHVGWCMAPPNIFLKLDSLVMIQTKFGFHWSSQKPLIISKIWHGVKMISTSRSTYPAILK
jgi:hypothetical protein